GLIILVVCATPFFIERVGAADAAWIAPAVTTIGLVGVAGLGVLMFLDRLPARISHWRIVHGLALLAADTRRVFLQPVHTIKVLFWAIVGNANITLAVYLMALSLGLDVTWLDCLILVPPVILITTLPISIAGWGIREGAMVTAFGLIGVPAEGALVLSLMFGLWGLVMGLPGGVIWLLSSDRKIQTIETTEAEAEATLEAEAK
ncbi:MAG: flippase-like domain-containing protein, partial [Rhodospirillaceae bacterium]|nr:flippase-like domain-containing protein [Rhodospirillaceae bacterium]